MKLKILYFAWLKSSIGTGEERVDVPDSIDNVAQLIDWLKTRSSGHATALGDLSVVRCAVNLDHVQPDTALKDGDEVGFFPPVTGGSW